MLPIFLSGEFPRSDRKAPADFQHSAVNLLHTHIQRVDGGWVRRGYLYRWQFQVRRWGGLECACSPSSSIALSRIIDIFDSNVFVFELLDRLDVQLVSA